MRRSSKVAALGAMTVMAAALVGPSSVAAAGNPALVNGKKTGPVAIPAKQKTVGSLPLTKGRWLVFAKAVIVGTGGSGGAHLGVDCRLKLGARSDLVSAAPAAQNAAGSRVPILLTTAGKLAGSGKALLRCVGEVGGAAKIRDIRITAVKVGKLTTRGTLTPAGRVPGPSATSGKGKPVVISAKQGGSRAVNGNGALHPVASLPLSAGRWWIVAKGVAHDGSTSAAYRCRLGTSAGGDYDEIGFPLANTGLALDASPFTLQVAHDFSTPGHAELDCLGNNDFRVRNVVINAIKVGKLTNDFRISDTSGSGTPQVVSGWATGPMDVEFQGTLATVFTRQLPKGKWLVLAEAWFQGSDAPNGGAHSVKCQLGFSGYKDDVELRYSNDETRVGGMVLQVPASASRAQPARLKCRRTGPGGSGVLLSVRITALKLGSILSWKL